MASLREERQWANGRNKTCEHPWACKIKESPAVQMLVIAACGLALNREGSLWFSVLTFGTAWRKEMGQFGADGSVRNGRVKRAAVPTDIQFSPWDLGRRRCSCCWYIKLDWKYRRHKWSRALLGNHRLFCFETRSHIAQDDFKLCSQVWLWTPDPSPPSHLPSAGITGLCCYAQLCSF